MHQCSTWLKQTLPVTRMCQLYHLQRYTGSESINNWMNIWSWICGQMITFIYVFFVFLVLVQVSNAAFARAPVCSMKFRARNVLHTVFLFIFHPPLDHTPFYLFSRYHHHSTFNHFRHPTISSSSKLRWTSLEFETKSTRSSTKSLTKSPRTSALYFRTVDSITCRPRRSTSPAKNCRDTSRGGSESWRSWRRRQTTKKRFRREAANCRRRARGQCK